MESLINLLTSEPQKLERLTILFLKFILTSFTFSIVYPEADWFNLFQGLTALNWTLPSAFPLYVLFFVIWWIVLWALFAKGILGVTSIMLSRVFSPARYLGEFLNIINILKIREKNQGHINYAILYVNDFLKAYEEDGEIDMDEFRIDIYLEVFVVSTLLIIISGRVELTYIQCVIWWIIGISLFISNAYLYRYLRFVNSSFSLLLDESNRLSYVEKARLALSQIDILNNQYDFEHKSQRIILSYKHSENELDELVIVPLYFNPGELQKQLERDFIRRIAEGKGHSRLTLYVTNHSFQLSRDILRRANCSVLIAESEAEMRQGLETFFAIYFKHRFEKLTEISGDGPWE